MFERFRPGFDIAAARRERAAASDVFLAAQDLYPDAAPCLRELRARGYRIGIAGNQPKGAVAALEALDLAVDIVVSSASMGVEKPSPEFFARLLELAGVPAREIAYVGDRLDNDVLPARAAGMATVFLLRGPVGQGARTLARGGAGGRHADQSRRSSGRAFTFQQSTIVHSSWPGLSRPSTSLERSAS